VREKILIQVMLRVRDSVGDRMRVGVRFEFRVRVRL
jgi:hypothetical protein